MPNIVLTNVCNLNCPYCFAGKVRTEEPQFLSDANLEKIIYFLKDSRVQEVGLIGGEPTLHPHFPEIAERLADDSQFRRIFVYSNGIDLAAMFPRLLRHDICFLINVNSPEDIGEKRFHALEEMLEAAQHYHMLGQISLGINLYRNNQDFAFVLNLCRRFGFSGLRLSVAIPPDAAYQDRTYYFQRHKHALMALYHEMKELNIIPKYDCNIIPPCLFDKNELEFLRTMPGSRSDLERITGENATCHPVIDIYPDLSLSRCFGMERLSGKTIEDFRDIEDIRKYYCFKTDGPLLYSDTNPACRECYQRQVLRCYGGCLSFLKRGNLADV